MKYIANNKIQTIIATFVCVLFVSVPTDSFAQSGLEGLSPEFPSTEEIQDTIEQPLRIQAITSSPQPGETVQISLNHYGRSYLDSSNITWIVNGEEYESGVGMKQISIEAGGLGSVYTVKVVVNRGSEIEETQTITFSVANIDLLWEVVDSYTHPFYKGKALPTMDSAVRMVAIPQVSNQSGMLPAENLIYNWSKDGGRRASDSGYGKNSILVLARFTRKTHSAEVEVEDPQSGSRWSTSDSFRLTEPEVLFYRKTPLGGIQYEREISESIDLAQGSSSTVVAEPHYFSNQDSLEYTWRLNGRSVRETTTSGNTELPLVSEQSGTSEIDLHVTNNDNIFQTGDGSVEIITP
ncbi:MAG: hypothetical protein U5L75_03140 [Candidatus Campbellbacteria bacterium]|nr:hypothetical protein [Candidatus Campbellbacteria bacterium]